MADIGLVAPLSKEPGPAAFIELLFFETAVVTAFSAGVPEMMSGSDEECAIPVYDSNNVLLWSKAIEHLIRNADERTRLARAGKKHVQWFFEEPVVENWSRAVRNLAG